MRALLKFRNFNDGLNERVGYLANWAVLLSCLISAGNATMRYAFDISSNAWLEVCSP